MAPDATSNHDLIVALCYADAISGMSTNTAICFPRLHTSPYFSELTLCFSKIQACVLCDA